MNSKVESKYVSSETKSKWHRKESASDHRENSLFGFPKSALKEICQREFAKKESRKHYQPDFTKIYLKERFSGELNHNSVTRLPKGDRRDSCQGDASKEVSWRQKVRTDQVHRCEFNSSMYPLIKSRFV